jgi:hypothetical protein
MFVLRARRGIGFAYSRRSFPDAENDFADKAAAVLRDAVNSGWENLEQLKVPDFDSLRKGQDFQKLLKQLEAEAASAR